MDIFAPEMPEQPARIIDPAAVIDAGVYAVWSALGTHSWARARAEERVRKAEADLAAAKAAVPAITEEERQPRAALATLTGDPNWEPPMVELSSLTTESNKGKDNG